MKTHISIIVPTRNRKEFVENLLIDLRSQILPDGLTTELIVVDQSKEPVDYDDCLYYHLDSTGPCKSRNFAASKSNGDILVFLDDDARVNSDFIFEMITPILSGNYVAVAGSNCDANGNYTADKEDFLQKKNFNFIKTLTTNPNSEKSRPVISFPGCCSAVTKSVFDEIGGFDENFDPTGAGEDREFAINLFKHGYIIYYNHKARLYHLSATLGGSRDVGSRTFNLQVNTHKIAVKHFSDIQADALKWLILKEYKRKVFKSLPNLRLAYYHFNQFKSIKLQLNNNIKRTI